MSTSARAQLKGLLINSEHPAHSTIVHLLLDDNILGAFVATDPVTQQAVLYIVAENAEMGLPAVTTAVGGQRVRVVRAQALATLLALGGD